MRANQKRHCCPSTTSLCTAKLHTSDAPPSHRSGAQVNLKRRHWTEQKTAAERCKEVFLSQIGRAQQAQKAAARPNEAASKQQQQRRTAAAADQAELREHVVESYRLHRASKAAASGLAATPRSLAQLVRGSGSG